MTYVPDLTKWERSGICAISRYGARPQSRRPSRHVRLELPTGRKHCLL